MPEEAWTAEVFERLEQEVVNDLSKGESSPILRTLRTLQR